MPSLQHLMTELWRRFQYRLPDLDTALNELTYVFKTVPRTTLEKALRCLPVVVDFDAGSLVDLNAPFRPVLTDTLEQFLASAEKSLPLSIGDFVGRFPSK